MFAGLYVRDVEIEFEVKHIENPLLINSHTHTIDDKLVNQDKRRISRFPSVYFEPDRTRMSTTYSPGGNDSFLEYRKYIEDLTLELKGIGITVVNPRIISQLFENYISEEEYYFYLFLNSRGEAPEYQFYHYDGRHLTYESCGDNLVYGECPEKFKEDMKTLDSRYASMTVDERVQLGFYTIHRYSGMFHSRTDNYKIANLTNYIGNLEIQLSRLKLITLSQY